MKVEQKNTGFTPIIITLETQEEANIMWAILNAPTDDVIKNSHGHLPWDKIHALIFDLWKAYNNIHPTGW